MSKMVVLRGLPASGKSVYALSLVNKGYKRINADDLRQMIDNGVYSKSNEKYITDLMQTMVGLALRSGFDVVLDNTNLNTYHINWAKDLCKEYHVELEIININTPIHICVERDLARTQGRVGRDVIMKMYNKYFVDGQFPGVE